MNIKLLSAVLEMLVIEDEKAFFFLCTFLILLNKTIIKFVFTKNIFIIIIKSDNYKPRLNFFLTLVHLIYFYPVTPLPAQPGREQEERTQKLILLSSLFLQLVPDSATNILNICHVPGFIVIKETRSLLSRSSGSRQEYNFILSALYNSLDIDLSVFCYIMQLGPPRMGLYKYLWLFVRKKQCFILLLS